MKANKFIENLSLRYPTNATDIRMSDVESYIERSKITEIQLDTIDLLVQENYGLKSFPSVKDIKDIYEKGYSIIAGKKHIVDKHTQKTNDIYYPQEFVNYVCNNLECKEVIKDYIRYENKNLNGHDLTTYEAYFLYVFNDLVNNYRTRLKNDCVIESENREKTEAELNILKSGGAINKEPEPLPTKDEIDLIKEMFKSIGRNKIIKNV